jgi:hypothetical protein
VLPQSWNMSLRSQLPRPESLNRRLIGPRLIKVFKLWMSDPSKRRMSQVLKASLWSKNSFAEDDVARKAGQNVEGHLEAV